MPQLIQIRGPAMVASTPLFRHESVALQTSLTFAAFVKEKALAKRDCLTLALLHCLITPLTNLPRTLITKTTTTMPGHDLHREQYHRCVDLFKQKKYTECIKLCLHSMTNPDMPRILQIQTLITISGAIGSEGESDDSWWKAEVSHAVSLVTDRLR